ncbi:hypothetical protein C8R45DRAFT_926927 [Mycena sanguinolenta]|nr:hypothetical protein C8R45DRAFT_926927 [Mycena sanguinolenta]
MANNSGVPGQSSRFMDVLGQIGLYSDTPIAGNREGGKIILKKREILRLERNLTREERRKNGGVVLKDEPDDLAPFLIDVPSNGHGSSNPPTPQYPKEPSATQGKLLFDDAVAEKNAFRANDNTIPVAIHSLAKNGILPPLTLFLPTLFGADSTQSLRSSTKYTEGPSTQTLSLYVWVHASTSVTNVDVSGPILKPNQKHLNPKVRLLWVVDVKVEGGPSTGARNAVSNVKTVKYGTGETTKLTVLDLTDFPDEQDLDLATWRTCYNTFLTFLEGTAGTHILQAFASHYNRVLTDPDLPLWFPAYCDFDRRIHAQFFTAPYIITLDDDRVPGSSVLSSSRKSSAGKNKERQKPNDIHRQLYIQFKITSEALGQQSVLGLSVIYVGGTSVLSTYFDVICVLVVSVLAEKLLPWLFPMSFGGSCARQNTFPGVHAAQYLHTTFEASIDAVTRCCPNRAKLSTNLALIQTSTEDIVSGSKIYDTDISTWTEATHIWAQLWLDTYTYLDRSVSREALNAVHTEVDSRTAIMNFPIQYLCAGKVVRDAFNLKRGPQFARSNLEIKVGA